MIRKKIYIASPYTLGDVAVNVKTQIDVAEEIIIKGYAPYTPLLSHFHHIVHPNDYNTWMDIGLSFLLQCDCVFRLHGESKGADIEVAFAKDHGIPVFTNTYDLYTYLESI